MEIFTIQVKILNSFQYCFHFLVDTLLHSTYLQFYIECAITVWYILYHRLEQCSEFKVTCMCAELLHCVWLFVTQYTVARQAPLSMGFSRQEYWGGLPCPPLALCFLLKAPTSSLPFSFSGAEFAFYFTEKNRSNQKRTSTVSKYFI